MALPAAETPSPLNGERMIIIFKNSGPFPKNSSKL